MGKHSFIGVTKHSGGHYRRFIELNNITSKLEKNGFDIISKEESNGFAPYKDEDPVCVRVIAQKL